jgi:hypothetical protein
MMVGLLHEDGLDSVPDPRQAFGIVADRHSQVPDNLPLQGQSAKAGFGRGKSSFSDNLESCFCRIAYAIFSANSMVVPLDLAARQTAQTLGACGFLLPSGGSNPTTKLDRNSKE